MYPIIQAPNEILRSATKVVDFSGAKLKKIVEEMRLTLILQKNPEGVGLAANQVGLPYRLFVARYGTAKNDPVHFFVNPELVDHGQKFQPQTKKTQLEGCLSLPRYYGLVKRWLWVKLRYQPIDDGGMLGDFVEEKFEDFPAVVIQHEMDHLNGKIFVEKILEQKGKLYKITGKDRQGKEMWEEVEL